MLTLATSPTDLAPAIIGDARAVVYIVADEGYTVLVLIGGAVVKEYQAGNNLHSSDPGDAVPPGHPAAVSRRALRKLARISALDLAAEFGVARSAIIEEEG